MQTLALAQAVAASSSDIIDPAEVAALALRVDGCRVTQADVDRALGILKMRGGYDHATLALSSRVLLARPLHFDANTPEAVQKILLELCGTTRKVRVFYGDAVTGKAWSEEHDVYGRINRSMGPYRVPLLIKPRADGGPAMLTACIVAIKSDAATFLYRHPTFDPGVWTHADASDVPGYVEAAYRDGELEARFKKPGQASRHCAFMAGRTLTP